MNTLRLMQTQDIPNALSIIAQAQSYLAAQGVNQWQDGYPNEASTLSDIRLRQGYVWEEDASIQAVITITFDGEPTYEPIYEGAWHSDAPYACIHRIAISKERRGTGLARALLQAAEELIQSRGFYAIRVDTHRQNMPMQRLLTRHGFQPCGIIYLQDGSERIAFDKALPCL